jgi:hypothetical protein
MKIPIRVLNSSRSLDKLGEAVLAILAGWRLELVRGFAVDLWDVLTDEGWGLESAVMAA